MIVSGTYLEILLIGRKNFGVAKCEITDFEGVDVIRADYGNVDFRETIFDEIDFVGTAFGEANF